MYTYGLHLHLSMLNVRIFFLLLEVYMNVRTCRLKQLFAFLHDRHQYFRVYQFLSTHILTKDTPRWRSWS
jgi:hypothetical protein